MTFEEFMATCRLTMRSGPDRVIVNHLGGAKTPDRAPIPEVVFVRDDGWSLGAPIGLIKAAVYCLLTLRTSALFRFRLGGRPFEIRF